MAGRERRTKGGEGGGLHGRREGAVERLGLCLALASIAFGCAAGPGSTGSLPDEAGAIAESPEAWLGGELVDLSYAYDADTIYWPTEAGFRKRTEAEGVTDQGYYYSAYELTTAEHGGTHLDAPRHFAAAGLTTDAVPLAALIGDAVVVDVRAQVEADRDYQLRVADLLDWEETHGPIPERAIVLVRTGYGRHWPDRAAYLGTDRRGPEAVPLLHFPGIHPEAATFLAAGRRVKAVGIDTASLDHGPSRAFETHRRLFARDIPGLENVANLERLPAVGARIVALPMKIAGGSGGPVRILGVLPGEAR